MFSEERGSAILEMIKAGKSRVDVCGKYPGYVRMFNKWIDNQFQVYCKKRNFVSPRNTAATCRVQGYGCSLKRPAPSMQA